MQSGNISLESVRSLILQVGGANRQQAEDQLMNFREDPGYLLALCELLNQETSNDILLVAALEFKNTVKTQWVEHQINSRIIKENKVAIKFTDRSYQDF